MLTKKRALSVLMVVVMGAGLCIQNVKVWSYKNVVASTVYLASIGEKAGESENEIEVVTPAAIASSEALGKETKKKKSLKLKTSKIVLGKGEKVAIPYSKKVKKAKFFINKCGVISISDAGVITGRKVGSVSVKISKGDESVTLKVRVKKKPSKVVLKEPEVSSVSIGTKIPLQLILGKNEASYNVTWKSSQKKVATVNKKGVITVKGTGLTVIKAITYNGKVGRIKLRFQ